MIKRIARRLLTELKIRRDPVAYARSIGVRVGDDVRFYSASPGMFGSDPYLITIGSRVHVTDGVKFITHDGGTLIFRGEVPDLEVSAPIIIGDDVYIGIGAILLPGVRIGSRCVIGAGSVVTKDIPPNSVAAGVPAHVIKTCDEYLAGLQRKSLHCGHLGATQKAEFLKRYYNFDHQ